MGLLDVAVTIYGLGGMVLVSICAQLETYICRVLPTCSKTLNTMNLKKIYKFNVLNK